MSNFTQLARRALEMEQTITNLNAEIRRLREMMLHTQHPSVLSYNGGHSPHVEGDNDICVHCANLNLEANLAAHRAVVRELAEALESAIAGRLWIDAARKALARPLVQSAREDRDAS
mgnify:CR=1 FL=1